jgi:hypothetical protein
MVALAAELGQQLPIPVGEEEAELGWAVLVELRHLQEVALRQLQELKVFLVKALETHWVVMGHLLNMEEEPEEVVVLQLEKLEVPHLKAEAAVEAAVAILPVLLMRGEMAEQVTHFL